VHRACIWREGWCGVQFRFDDAWRQGLLGSQNCVGLSDMTRRHINFVIGFYIVLVKTLGFQFVWQTL